MAAPTLNRARPFGTISGDEFGRMYEQDHQFFMGDGSLWSEPERAPVPELLPDEAPKPAPKKAKAAAEPLAQDAQLDAQLGEA
jgi:hypothetical protein